MTTTAADSCFKHVIDRPTGCASLVIDRLTTPASIVELAFRTQTLDPRHSFVRSFTISASIPPSSLLPEGVSVQRCVTHQSGVVVLGHGPAGSLLITGYPRATTVSLSAASALELDALETAVRRRVPKVEAPGEVRIRTWHQNPRGQYQATERTIGASNWSSIERNYPKRVRQQLEQLMSLILPTGGGKLILWHGDPGTGKTTALRALMRAWQGWCSSQYLADPEKFFADPGYISEVLTRPTPWTGGPTFETSVDNDSLWRLIVAEDSDEYLRATARRDAGAGLGRLLNLADGVLGQGFNTLILLTTNEEVTRLHPALTRPGRCLARVEFTTFSPKEAQQWLPDGSEPPDGDLTLAELFERAGKVNRIGQQGQNEQHVGQYL